MPGRPPVLFLHAAGGAARNFGSVVRRVPGSSAIDLPGHGRAGGEPLRTIEAMAAFALRACESIGSRVRREGRPSEAPREIDSQALSSAGEGRIVLAGHSMGGAVALAAAAAAPGRAAGVVLLATGARLQFSRSVADKARDDWEGFLAALAAGGSPLMTIEQLRQTGQAAVAADLAACVPWDGVALAPRVRAPALLVAGARDRVAPPALVRELAAAFPGSRVVVLDGAGHVLPVERPEEVAREVNAFVDGLAAQ